MHTFDSGFQEPRWLFPRPTNHNYAALYLSVVGFREAPPKLILSSFGHCPLGNVQIAIGPTHRHPGPGQTSPGHSGPGHPGPRTSRSPDIQVPGHPGPRTSRSFGHPGPRTSRSFGLPGLILNCQNVHQVMFPHQSVKVSHRSQVSRVALCMSKVEVL